MRIIDALQSIKYNSSAYRCNYYSMRNMRKKKNLKFKNKIFKIMSDVASFLFPRPAYFDCRPANKWTHGEKDINERGVRKLLKIAY